jgi:superfamily II DNA/RNA helicase
VDTGKLDLSNVKFFVLDEADQLLDQDEQGVLNLYQKMTRKNLQVFFIVKFILWKFNIKFAGVNV